MPALLVAIRLRRRAPHGAFLVLVVLAAAGSACADALPDDSETTPAQWSAEVVLRIGSVEDAETALTFVGSILAAPDGRIYLTQPQEGYVRVHGPDGELLGRIGARGEGPGEFSGLGTLGWWGEGRDTLWASDSQLRRVSLFRPDGAFVRTILVAPPPYQDVMTILSVAAIVADGTGLALPSYPSRLLADGTIRSIPVLRFSLPGEEPEVVVETEPGIRQLALEFGGGMSFSGQPYGDAPLVAVSGAAGRVVVVERPAAARPDQARFRVTAVEVTGDTLWTREYPYAPLPVPAAEADSVRSGVLEGRLDFALRAGASRSDLERQVRERLYLPAFRPPLAAVRISADGSVWLQWTAVPGETATRWLGLDPDGDPVARLELPRNVSLREVDGANAWAVETDELGVPYVVRLRLGPSDPSQ